MRRQDVMARRSQTEILIQARELIAAPDMWSQGSLVTGTGAHCAIGAVIAARLNRPRDHTVDGWKYQIVVRPLLRKLAAHIPGSRRGSAWGKVAAYNNHHSHDQVLRLFDAAIDAK